MQTATTLYLECKSGISGDMLVGALLDLGASRKKLLAALESLHLPEVSVSISEVMKSGLRACDFDVRLFDPHHGHHGHSETEPGHHHHHHEHRNLASINTIIGKAALTERARALAQKMFSVVAQAEGKVHGKPLDEVHFHEVGALDSIVDIVAAAVCIDDLGITQTWISPLHEGCGFVECQHGRLPVPVPAVVEIAAAHHLPLTITETPQEMVTPTGIAIAAALEAKVKNPDGCIIHKVGYGAGKRDLSHPNVLRAFLLAPQQRPEDIWMLETNLDDATGEQLGHTLELLMQGGARDAHFVPAFMKKNRPGWLLRVVTDEAHIPQLEEIIFRNTPTIGIRRFPFLRTCLERESIEVKLPCGTVQVKKCRYGEYSFCYPEYESVKSLAEKSGLSFMDIFAEAQRQAQLR